MQVTELILRMHLPRAAPPLARHLPPNGRLMAKSCPARLASPFLLSVMRPCRDGVPCSLLLAACRTGLAGIPAPTIFRCNTPTVPCHRRYIDLVLEVRTTQGTGGAYIALKAAVRAIFHFRQGAWQSLPPDYGDSGVRTECVLWPRCCAAFDGREDVGQQLTVLLQKTGTLP